MERKSGVLLHISSLWGDYSCGAFGKEGREFVDFLKQSGFSYWQVLPFCMPDKFASPYSSYSAFSVNPWFIDLKDLFDCGLVTERELINARQKTPYACEFGRLDAERFALLSKAAERFRGGKDFYEFFRKHPHTEDFCRFMALRAANRGKKFWLWKNGVPDESVLKAWKFICYTFMRQWGKLKAYANENGVKIIGDIPIYTALDSSDVWSAPDQFLVDQRYRPTRVAGVPPDYFSADGQLWGNPLYNWDAMKKDGYKWWCDRMAFMCEMFDVIRIDHFRGLESFYACSPRAKNARNGVWMKGPGMDLITRLKRVCKGKTLIAEDLGVITPEVKALVEKSGFPGMRVFQFGFDGYADTPHIPHNFGRNSVAYTGTHDNNTLLGFVWEIDGDKRKNMLEYCGYTGWDWNSREAYDSIIRTVLRSDADTAIFPLQDLLLFGADTRMNTPGEADGNWKWRVTRQQLDKLDRAKLKHLNLLYGRCEQKKVKPE
ncbi:MAG: 4-alpha-glucanotransferase [Clostridia bacterium]|nr:4-alpha-glucanotransferase [Clostridia bacterium]